MIVWQVHGSEVDVLIFGEGFRERGVDDVGLVGVHGPAHREVELLLLELGPTATPHHELPRDLAPPLLPVQPGVVDEHCYLIDSSVVSNKGEPAAGHSSELVLVLDESVVVEFVLVDGALLVEGDGVVLAELVQGDHIFLHPLHLHLALNVPLEGRQEETVGTLLYLGYLDVLGLLDGLPVLGMLHEETLRQVTDAVGLRLGSDRDEGLRPLLVVDELQRPFCVEHQTHLRALLGDHAVILAEDNGRRPEEPALLSQLLDVIGGRESCFVEGEVPVVKSSLELLHIILI